MAPRNFGNILSVIMKPGTSVTYQKQADFWCHYLLNLL